MKRISQKTFFASFFSIVAILVIVIFITLLFSSCSKGEYGLTCNFPDSTTYHKENISFDAVQRLSDTQYKKGASYYYIENF